jgi:hypothetical protein
MISHWPNVVENFIFLCHILAQSLLSLGHGDPVFEERFADISLANIQSSCMI